MRTNPIMSRAQLLAYPNVKRETVAPAASGRGSGGANAAHAGKAFEELILRSQSDEHGRVLSIIKLPSGARWLGPGKMVPAKSPFDFCGSFVSGVGIFFDAKSLDETVASFPANDAKILKPHQIESLNAMYAGGAVSGALVSCGRHRDFRWIDAPHLITQKPIQWNDARWLIVGLHQAGGLVRFRGLAAAR